MLIAVATKSGTEVDQHFGHAEAFTIYKYSAGDPQQVKKVAVDKYCSFDPDHPFRHRQFDAIVKSLAGCRAVVSAMIGDLPRQELEKAGIRSVVTSGPVGEALKLAHDSVCEGGCKKGKTPETCPHS